MPPALSYANVVQAALMRQAHRILAGYLFPGLAKPALQNPLEMAQPSTARRYIHDLHLEVRQKGPQDKNC